MGKASFYCLRCRKSFEAKGRTIKLKNGATALEAKCPSCKTRSFRIIAFAKKKTKMKKK